MTVKYECVELSQEVIDDLFLMESQGATGFIAKQVARFFDQLPDHIQSIDDSIVSKDFDSLRHHIHKINGFSGILGAHKVREVALEMEKNAIDKNLENIPVLLDNLKVKIETASIELRRISEISLKNSCN